MKTTEYAGSIVAYVERNCHQYAHTVMLDGVTSWIDDGMLVVEFPDGEQILPASWNFVHYRKGKKLSLTKDFENIGSSPGVIVMRDTLPFPLYHNQANGLGVTG